MSVSASLETLSKVKDLMEGWSSVADPAAEPDEKSEALEKAMSSRRDVLNKPARFQPWEGILKVPHIKWAKVWTISDAIWGAGCHKYSLNHTYQQLDICSLVSVIGRAQTEYLPALQVFRVLRKFFVFSGPARGRCFVYIALTSELSLVGHWIWECTAEQNLTSRYLH
ncbi:hypothetical protein K438DRAFT_1762702 [Mycena galopus ATCC 62051]|nr:hypothetical protein K438DRAFT_1762702 [Mycena galopus ATCC 62051]